VQSEKISQLFRENLNNAKNLSREIKTNLMVCLSDFIGIIKNQDNVINQQKSYIINELKETNGRQFLQTKQLTEEIAEIKSQLLNKSYASVLKTNNSNVRPKPARNLVIIRPQNESQDCKQTEMQAKHIIISNKLNIGVKYIKNISKGGVVLDCDANEDTDKIIETIREKSNDIIASKPLRKMPNIVIYGVSDDISEKDIIDELINKNDAIAAYLNDSTTEDINQLIKIKFKFRRKNKSINENNWVLEIGPKLRSIIFNQIKSLRIGFKSCKFSDYFSITRCYNCNGFAHIAKDCKQHNPSCGHCGQTHNTKECNISENQAFCTNCDKHNKASYNKSKTFWATNHSCYSGECESLRRIRNLIIAKTCYEY
jgi:hypothetical protein